MEIKTYRARSLQQALQWIQSDLGPDAAVLHTRELRSGLMEWLRGRQLEVTAGVGVRVPSRFPMGDFPARDTDESTHEAVSASSVPQELDPPPVVPPAHEMDYRGHYRRQLLEPRLDSPSLVEELCLGSGADDPSPLPASLAEMYTKLIDADFDEESALELIQMLRRRSLPRELNHPVLLNARLLRLIEDGVKCAGPIHAPRGSRRVIAFVGPTGVGKTTTIAKLAATFQLEQQRRVGLVTADTYRVAAVEQLRTYANILELPMEVASNLHELPGALDQLSDRDLILLDTAGHSPGDGERLGELEMLLHRARADEVQLVASGVASLASLKQATACFAAIGATRMILTKLDEATRTGHLWPLLHEGRLPLSYVTNGPNVPADFAAADAREISRKLLRWNEGT